MNRRPTPLAVHLIGAALASAVAAYWVLRLIAAAPAVVAAAPGAVLLRDPDPALAARLFGDLNTGPALASRNVQLGGVFFAGKQSSAVIAVDGRPARAVLLGQEAAPGMRLVEVRADGIVLDGDGRRTQYAVPPIAVAKSSASAPLFRREGNTLTAPSQEPAPSARGAAPRAGAGAPNVPPSGMLLPPPQRSGADEPGARAPVGGFGNGAAQPPVTPATPAPGN